MSRECAHELLQDALVAKGIATNKAFAQHAARILGEGFRTFSFRSVELIGLNKALAGYVNVAVFCCDALTAGILKKTPQCGKQQNCNVAENHARFGT